MPVGATAAQTVTVAVQVEGTLGAVQVLTLGVQDGDFTASSSGSTCLEGSLYAVGQLCSVPVTFTPAFPGVRIGAVLLLSENGTVLATKYLTGTGVGGLGILVPGVIRSVAGNGQWTAVGDGQLATAAELFLPSSVAVDGGGNLYIADSIHNRIRRVDAATGVITTVAGNGDSGYSGDNAPAVDAELNTPRGVTLDGAGNVYIADSGNHVIRKLTPKTGVITTVAGNGAEGDGGDGGNATSAQLNFPCGVTIDAVGNIVIADTWNHRIRLVSASTGEIATIVGNGATTNTGAGSYSGDGGAAPLAGLNFPYAVGYDPSGNMYIPDSGNNRIREVSATTGRIETVAGTNSQGFAGDNGPAVNAGLYAPSSVAFDAAENLYIADTQNNRIRKVNAATGIITTVAGNGTGKFGGDGGSAVLAELYGPYAVVADAAGDLLIADYFDNRIREISSANDLLSFTPATRVGNVSAPQSQLIENDGNGALGFAAINPGANTAIDAASTTCSLTSSISPDSTCIIGVEFAPSEAGTTVLGNIILTETPGNALLDIGATGQALALNSTNVVLTSSANPAVFAQALQLAATVTSGTGTPTGAVTFTDGGNVLGAPVPLSALGTAAYTLSSLSVGLHSIVAAYGGDPNHLASVSTVLTQVVDEVTATTVASSQNPSILGAGVTFSATVSSLGGGVTPAGSVSFLDGASSLGTAALDSQGRASLPVAGLTAGSHSITAAYGGLPSAYVMGSSSSPLLQVEQGQTATLLNSSANPTLFGQPVQLLATVTSSLGTPTGTVTFADGGSVLGAPVPLSASGSAAYTISSPGVGLHPIVAAYGGDATHIASASSILAQSVDEATGTMIVSSANPSAPNASVTFSAIVAGGPGGLVPRGAVVFQDGAALLGTVTLDSQGRASLPVAGLTTGSHSITAAYNGIPNTYILGSASSPLNQMVQGQTSTLLSSSANPSTYGSAAVFTASVSTTAPISATGTVTFFDGAQQIGSAALASTGGNAALSTGSISTSALTAGLHLMSAVYGGNQWNAGSAAPAFAQTVQAAATTVTGGSSPNPSLVLSPVLLSARVTGNRGSPGGVVVFLADETPLSTQTLDSTGFAFISTSTLAVGLHQLSVNYLGDENDSPSSSQPLTQTVQLIPTTTSLSISTSSGASDPVSLSATVVGASGPVPTGSVAFRSGSITLGTGILNSSGIAVLAVASSLGTTNIVAAYPGDLVHAPSSSVPLSAPTIGSGFQLTLDPDSVTLPTSQNIQLTVTLDPSAGFTDQIGLGCASLPALVTCYFSNDSVALNAKGIVTEQLTIDTDSPLSGGPVASNARSRSKQITSAGSLLPAAFVLAGLLCRRRKRGLKLLQLGWILLGAIAASQMTGCGAISQKSAAPGIYVIQVIATGIDSGITQSANLTVDVTR